MSNTHFGKIRLLIAAYISIIVSVAVTLENPWLALAGVATGVLCLWFVKKKLAVKTSDERTQHIAGKAATMTYSIISTALAIVSLLLTFLAEEPYLQSIGILLSYLTFAQISVFAVLYRYYLSLES